jgi:hypothetical protein
MRKTILNMVTRNLSLSFVPRVSPKSMVLLRKSKFDGGLWEKIRLDYKMPILYY